MACHLLECVRALSKEISEVSTFVVLRVVTTTENGKSAHGVYFYKKSRWKSRHVTVILKWNFGGKIMLSYDTDVTSVLCQTFILTAQKLEVYLLSFSLFELHGHISIKLQQSVLTF